MRRCTTKEARARRNRYHGNGSLGGTGGIRRKSQCACVQVACAMTSSTDEAKGGPLRDDVHVTVVQCVTVGSVGQVIG